MQTIPRPSSVYMQGLSKVLSLQTPSTSKDSPSIFEFERFRDVKFDWLKNIRENYPNDDEVSPIEDIKEYFYSNWKKNYKDSNVFKDDALFSGLTGPGPNHEYKENEFWAYDEVFYIEGIPPATMTSFKEVFCMVHKPSQRLHCFLDKNLKPLDKTALAFPAGATNAQAWEIISRFHELRLVVAYKTQNLLLARRSTVNYIKREALLFKEEYQRLKSQLQFVEKFSVASENYTNELFKNNETFKKLWDDSEEFEKVSDTYSNVINKKAAIELKIRQLAEKVKELGYYLSLKMEKIGNPEVQVQEGKIYQTRLDTYIRQEVYTRMVWNRIRSGKNTYWVYQPVQETRDVPATFLNYIEVSFDVDPIVAETNKLSSKDYNVYFVRKENSGFYTETGVPLETILKQCENDEAFREKCCIVIPKYDFIISNKSYYVGAFIYKCPLPGLIPSRFPTIGIREELSYRLAWIGTEIGNLVSSINLAPGETRTMMMSSKFKQTTSQTASFKSVTDVNTSESFDLATEFQNEASNELTRTNSFSASASGGFGIGPFSASASASGSRSTTLKTFSKEMARVAKKTAQTLNRKLSQEITSSSSVMTEVNQETSKSITITNINKGSTLNLFFYQVNNRYDSALYVTNIEMMIGATRELIAGSGLYDTYSFRMHELNQAFEKLHPDQLPGRPFGEGNEAQWSKYWKALQEALNNTINEEYSTGNSALDSAGVVSIQPTPRFERIATRYLDSGQHVQANQKDEKEKKDSQREFRAALLASSIDKNDALQYIRSAENFLTECQVKDLMEVAFENLEIVEGPLEPQKVIIASGGLYVDSHLGIMPSTEEYSELMRSYEAKKVEVDIERQDALNDEVRAKTALLLSGATYIKNIFTYSNNVGVQKIYFSLLQLTANVADKIWKVYLKNAEVNNCTVDFPSAAVKNALVITWPGEAPAADVLEKDLYLVHPATGITLRKI